MSTVPLRRIYALIVIEHGTPRSPGRHHRQPRRRVDNPGSPNFPMNLGARATPVKFLIRDRAGQFTDSFDAVFTAEGIRILVSPPQAPRANASCERNPAPGAFRSAADRQ